MAQRYPHAAPQQQHAKRHRRRPLRKRPQRAFRRRTRQHGQVRPIMRKNIQGQPQRQRQPDGREHRNLPE